MTSEPVQYLDAGGDPQYVSEAAPFPVSIQGADITIDNVTVSNEVEISNEEGNPVPVSGSVNTLAGLEIPPHDYISMSYTDGNLSGVVYKDGGSGGTTVATLTLSYTDGNLTSVAKS